jgi:glutamate synthase domain-containing protein 2
MAYGVTKGREAVNFSEWGTYAPEAQRTLLSASCQDVSDGKMPGPYTLLRPETRLSAQHVEADIDAALAIGVDYIILDGRGGGTGAAPLVFRDNISVPTIPALARARRHLDRNGRRDVTLIATGGLRDAADFAKALALGADAIAIANSAIQAIGCLGMRACHTNNCPVGIATQKPHLRARLPVDEASQRLDRFLRATVELMQVLARACGHAHLSDLALDDPRDRRARTQAARAAGGFRCGQRS